MHVLSDCPRELVRHLPWFPAASWSILHGRGRGSDPSDEYLRLSNDGSEVRQPQAANLFQTNRKRKFE